MWYQYAGNPWYANTPPFWMSFLIPFVLLDLILKGFALWRSAQRCEKGWFIAILIINSLGILPAFYLLTHPSKSEPACC